MVSTMLIFQSAMRLSDDLEGRPPRKRRRAISSAIVVSARSRSRSSTSAIFSLDPRLDQPGGFRSDRRARLPSSLNSAPKSGSLTPSLLLDGNRRETNLATHETRTGSDPATGQFRAWI